MIPQLALAVICAAAATIITHLSTPWIADVADTESPLYRTRWHIWTAAVLAALAPALSAGPASMIGWTLVGAFLGHLFVVDLHEQRLPDRLNLTVGVAALFTVLATGAETGDWRRSLVALACGAGVFVVYLLMHGFQPGKFGAGDVKLGPSIGALTGLTGVLPMMWGMVAGFVLHSVIGVWLMFHARNTVTRETLLPFGPSMILGAYGAMLMLG